MSAAQRLINSKTKIVALTYMSNVLGTINPVAEIAAMAHNAGALVVVDGAQAVSHMLVDVQKIDCDFLVFSGHKMLGPTGIGVLYGRKKLLEKLTPVVYGGGMIKEVSFEKSSWADAPGKFEAGTPPIAEAIGLRTAVEYLQQIGMEKVREHTAELTSYALSELKKMSGVTILGPMTQRGPVISFLLEGIHPHDIAEILDKEGIAVRAGHHCAMPLFTKLGLSGSTRASFHIYNTTEDVDALVAGIRKAQQVFR